MLYQISASQRHFFEENKYIEFEELLTDSQWQTLEKELSSATIQQNSVRNLVPKSEVLRTILFHPRISLLAATLIEKAPLIYAFDEYLCEANTRENLSSITNEVSLQGLEVCMTLFIQKQIVSFFKPDMPLEINPKSADALIFGWGKLQSQYIFCSRDPYTHQLKKEGLTFGDTLGRKEHPVLCRRL